MSKQAKPKANKGSRNDSRKNGKAFKQNPKDNSAGATGRTNGGYTEAALARRAAKRAPLTFAGLVESSKN